MVNRIKGLLQTLYNYFSKSPKRHLEFMKLAELMEMKGAKILKNVKNLVDIYVSPTQCVMAKYKTLLMKMALDGFIMTKPRQILSFFVMCKVY